MHGILKRIIDYSFSFWYYIFGDFMYEKAIEILNILYKNKYEAYIVGGYVRDKLLNIENSDIDICTNATPDKLKNIFDICEDNSEYGSLKIEYNGYLYEITTFRKEKYIGNRFPKVTYIKDLKEDLKRRDFTINTICIDKDENIVDLYNGEKDLKLNILKSIGNPYVKFDEDPIRILRAIRFKNALNLNYEDTLKEAIKEKNMLLKNISKKRIKKELNKMNEYAICELKSLDIYSYIEVLL